MNPIYKLCAHAYSKVTYIMGMPKNYLQEIPDNYFLYSSLSTGVVWLYFTLVYTVCSSVTPTPPVVDSTLTTSYTLTDHSTTIFKSIKLM